MPTARQHSKGTEYTIVTTLEVRPGGPVYACRTEFISLPPPPCGGVEIRNADAGTVAALGGDLPGLHGTRRSRSVRIVGTWDGQALTLTRPPVPASQPSPTPLPVLSPPPDQAADEAEVVRIAHDSTLKSEGVSWMEAGVNSDGVYVLLPVADSHSVQVIHSRYPDAHVSGWLQPA
jgi:hypothetical protein